MEGIQFLTNDKGERVAVQIDLRKHAEIWEDVLRQPHRSEAIKRA